MGIRVKLQDVVTEMDVPSESWMVYLNKLTGQFVTVTDEEILGADDTSEEDLESEDYVALPDKFEINEWSLMEQFCLSVGHAEHKDKLLNAIHGRGAFRFFKSTIHELEIAEEWYRFRDEAFTRIATAWLRENGIEFDREPRGRGEAVA